MIRTWWRFGSRRELATLRLRERKLRVERPRLRTRRVCRWRDGKMVLRWAAALLMTEQRFRKIMGYRDLWMLKAALDQNGVLVQQDVA